MIKKSRAAWGFAMLPIALAASVSYSGTLTVDTSRWAATDAKAFVLSGMTDTGAADANKVLTLVVTLKLQNKAALDAAFKHVTTVGDPLYKHYLSSKQFADTYAPTMTQAAGVMDYLRAKGFSNIELSDNRLQIRMTGTVAQAQAAFNTQLHNFQYQGKAVISNTTPALVPAAFSDVVLGVVGLSTVQIMHLNHPKKVTNATPAVGAPTIKTEYTPGQFQKIYDVGNTPDGSKVAIAIMTEGDLTQVVGAHPGVVDPNDPNFDKTADLRAAETAHKQPYVPVTLIKVGADHSDAAGQDEWDLDTQHASGLADNVKMMYVYDTASLYDTDIITMNNQFAADNLAIGANASFSGCESTEQAYGTLGAYEQTFLQMAMQGQTYFSSTGDNGSGCGTPSVGAPGGGIPGVGYPASSPYVIGVGGTNVTTNSDGTYDTESAWEGTGGGTSTFLKGGAWQTPVVPTSAAGFKGIPDIAMPAGELSAGEVYVSGKAEGVEGTSMSSPQSLGIWARLQSAKVTPTNPNPLGFAAPDFYANAVSATAAAAGAVPTGFHDIVAGANGTYAATPGWDFVSGIGSFDIAKLNGSIKYLSTPAPAGTQTRGGDACALPGNRVSLGTVGSSADGVNGADTTAVQKSHNVTAAYVSEHYTAGQVDGYTFSLDVGQVGTGAGLVYFVYFVTDDNVRHYVAYEPTPDPTETKASSFSYGHIVTTQVTVPMGGGLGEAVFAPSQEGLTTGTAVPGTGTQISIFVPRSAVPTISSSKALTAIFGEVDTETGFLDQGTSDQINALNSTDQGTFKPDPAFYCFPVPVAALTATPTTVMVGNPVTFNAGASSAATGESVLSYNFDFGDGTTSGFQPKASLMHTYTAASPSGKPYTASVSVIDTSGKSSTNAATQAVTVTPPPAPTSFTFAERTNVAQNDFVTSENVTLAGTAGASYAISVAGGSSMQYSLNDGPWTSAAGTIKVGDKFAVRHVSASGENQSVSTTVTVGGYTTTFKSTTGTLDHVPDAFDFGTQTDAAPGAVMTSAPVTPTGYDNAQVLASPGASYSVNGGPFTSAAGTIAKGQSLVVRQTSSKTSLAYAKVYVSIGGVKGYFTVRTKK